MNNQRTPPPVTESTIRQLAALNGLALTPERAEPLAPMVADLLAADARLAALEFGTLPAAGLPWAAFGELPGTVEEASHGE